MTPEEKQKIITLLDGIDFENGEITVAKRQISENLAEIRNILSDKEEKF